MFPFLFSALLDVLSMATALDDFIAPDCRFINIRKGQRVYVYSKLVPEEGAGVYWSGSVCEYFFHVIYYQCSLQLEIQGRTCRAAAVTNKRELSCFFDKSKEGQMYKAYIMWCI